MKTILFLLAWYGIFIFISNEINPMNWSVFGKIMAVLIGFSVINSNLDKY